MLQPLQKSRFLFKILKMNNDNISTIKNEE